MSEVFSLAFPQFCITILEIKEMKKKGREKGKEGKK